MQLFYQMYLNCACLTIFLCLQLQTHAIKVKVPGQHTDDSLFTIDTGRFTPHAMQAAFAKGLGGPDEFRRRINERLKWNWVDVYAVNKFSKANVSDCMQERELAFPHNHARFDALGPVLQCPSSMFYKFGQGDGGKHVCGLLAEEARGLTHDPCVIVSAGSNNKWDFEVAIGTQFANCQIHTLDCFVHGTPPEAIASHTTFHDICLAEKDYIDARGRQFMSWPTFMEHIKLTGQPTVLKMDIEGYEWQVIESMIKSPSSLPMSISLELHYEAPPGSALSWYGRLRSPFEIGGWMDYVFTRGGYLLVDRNDNPKCPHCSEIVLAQLSSHQIML